MLAWWPPRSLLQRPRSGSIIFFFMCQCSPDETKSMPRSALQTVVSTIVALREHRFSCSVPREIVKTTSFVNPIDFSNAPLAVKNSCLGVEVGHVDADRHSKLLTKHWCHRPCIQVDVLGNATVHVEQPRSVGKSGRGLVCTLL